MNMGGDHSQQVAEQTGRAGVTGEQEQVAFTYRLTLADIRGAIRARARRTPAGRAETLLLPLLTAVATVGLGLLDGSHPAVLVASAVAALSVAIVGVFWIRRSMARRVFSVAEPYGECRTVADDRGTATTGETMSYTMDWTLFVQYTETPELFVLFGGTRAAAVAALPKRGAEHPGDVDRMRAILARNLKRV
ncbi:YcxB family protein [Streptomyces xanthophaeus]|uniref:YcxB family protein n=1 Tax=Streptomyces xanthophaeus TaxID=67385 RepID=UPI0026476A50|nr:YcxB family protein [Streptomyces xanthophaeus]WKD34741.1 YcxB family protein [Streptomyces xanthophaeus]